MGSYMIIAVGYPMANLLCGSVHDLFWGSVLNQCMQLRVLLNFIKKLSSLLPGVGYTLPVPGSLGVSEYSGSAIFLELPAISVLSLW